MQTKENTKIIRKVSRKKRASQGLGDTIAKITEATGIDKLVRFALGEDCGCDERKEKLNKLFPYNRQPLCMNEGEYIYWSNFRKTISVDGGVQIAKENLDMISRIYSRVFQTRSPYRPCTCNPRAWNEMIEKIEKLYSTYGN